LESDFGANTFFLLAKPLSATTESHPNYPERNQGSMNNLTKQLKNVNTLMNLTFLGTGPSTGIPKKECRDLICQEARKKSSKSKRTRSSALLKANNFNLLIDCSPDFLQQVKQERIKKINYVIITHAHRDASGGIKKLNLWTKNKIIVCCQKQTIKKITSRYRGLNKLEFRAIKPYQKFKIKNLAITALPVKHYVLDEKNFPTLAYKFKNFIYCSDVIKIPTKSLKHFKDCPNLILDAAMYFKRQFISHLNTRQAIELAQKQKVKKLYLTQIGHSYPPYKIAGKEIARFVKAHKIKTKVFLAYDGLKIKL